MAPGTTSYFQGKNIDGQEITYILSSLNLAVYMSFIIDDTRLRLTYICNCKGTNYCDLPHIRKKNSVLINCFSLIDSL